MKEFKKKLVGAILPILGAATVFLASLTTAYSGEWELKVPSVVKGALEIEILNKQFTDPENEKMAKPLLVVPEGMTVSWVNKDPLSTISGDLGLMPHGIQIADEDGKVLAASPILVGKRGSYSYTFDTFGTYSYECFIHPSMKGSIVVVDMAG